MIFTESTALENQKSDAPKLSLQYEKIAADTHTLRSLDWDEADLILNLAFAMELRTIAF